MQNERCTFPTIGFGLFIHKQQQQYEIIQALFVSTLHFEMEDLH